MTRDHLTVAGIQLTHSEGDRKANLAQAIKAIESVEPHDIYVLPELSSSGYSVGVFQALDDLAEELEGPSFQTFSALAAKNRCFICYSFPRRIQANGFTICTAVVDRRGDLVACYDKLHVCSVGVCCEKDYFSPGQKPPVSFAVDNIQVGLAICYDIRFPELTRALAVEHGISLLLHPGGWPKDECFDTWHTFVQVRAMENQIYIMSTNWAGKDNGSTLFCPPFVDARTHRMATLQEEPGVLTGVVDLGYLEEIRDRYPYLIDKSTLL